MIRKANISDIKPIHQIIGEQAQFGHILPRPMAELYGGVRDFIVAVDGNSGDVIGCGALQIIWEDLAEIRSLAVLQARQDQGIGTRLIETLLDEAREMSIKRVFVLTYRPRLFERQSFTHMDKGELPHKIWADCIKCTKFPECDEIALVRNP